MLIGRVGSAGAGDRGEKSAHGTLEIIEINENIEACMKKLAEWARKLLLHVLPSTSQSIEAGNIHM